MSTARTALGPLLTVLVLAISTGCAGDSDSDAEPASAASIQASVTPSEAAAGQTSAATATSPVEPRVACLAGTPPFTGPAAKTFGADRVIDALCTYSPLAQQWGFQEPLVRESENQATAAEFADVRDFMTPDTVEDWDQSVKASLGGDADEFSAVWALKWFNTINGSPYAFAETPAFRKVEVTDIKAAVDDSQSEPGLKLTLSIAGTANIIEKKSNRPYSFTLSKDLDLYLVPRAGGTTDPPTNWLIDGYFADFENSDPVPR